MLHLPLSLAQLQRIKRWQVAHRRGHPLEFQTFDAMLTLWVMGWVGVLPSLVLKPWLLLPLCALAVYAPALYVAWRASMHAHSRLRCDWLGAASKLN